MNITKEIKSIEKEEARLAQKKKELMLQKKEAEARDKALETLVKNSGYGSAKDLVEALVDKYNVKLTAAKRGSPGRKRTRTKVTKELRDQIKKEVKDGQSMNAVSKAHKVSYVVVSKIVKGAYDKLK
jgi:hypothetical protein